MNNIFTIFKKELTRFFSDKRMLFSLILPGILIFVLYSIMGSFISSSMTATDDYNYNVYVYNQSQNLISLNLNDNFNITIYSNEKTESEAKIMLENKEIDLIIVFEENFDEKQSKNQSPKISIFYNSTSSESTNIYNYYNTALSAMSIKDVIYNFKVNSENFSYDLATKEDSSAQFITMMVPFLLMILLFSGCMSVTSESIAGEKERGTISTLLVTPTKRSHIAIGKVLALTVTSLVSSLSSFIGLLLSLPKLLGSSQDITLDMYGFSTYLSIFILMIIAVIFFTAVLSIISAFAKSVKEASQYGGPVMIIVMMLGITSLLGTNVISSSPFIYLLPVYNIVQCMGSIFSLSFKVLPFIITIISNLVYISLGIFILTKIFNSEKIMFNK